MDSRHIRKNITSQFNRVASWFQPLNLEDTVMNTLGAMQRIPVINREHYFVNLLNTHDYVEQAESEDPKVRDERLRTSGFKQLTTPRPINIKHETKQSVLVEMDKLFGLNDVKFVPLQAGEAVNTLPTTSSSSYPDFKKKGILASYLIKQLKFLETKWDDSVFKTLFVVVNWRIHPRVSGIKFRMFYALSGLVQAAENKFVRPYLRHFESNRLTPYAFANTYRYLRTRWLSWQKFDNIVSIDIEGFDLSINNKLLFMMFTYIKSKFHLNNKEQHLMYEGIVTHNLSCQIATSIKGKPAIFRKTNGLMSGSVFTNLLGTFVNTFCILYFLIDTGRYEGNPIAICGDDCIIPINGDITIDEIVEYYSRVFGLTVSREKSEIFKPGEPVFFLGYHFDDKARYFDWELAKRQLSISERHIDTKVMSTPHRLISKLASLCFKCKDGYKFFDMYAKGIADYYGIPIPKYFANLFSITGLDYGELREISEIKETSWMDQ